MSRAIPLSERHTGRRNDLRSDRLLSTLHGGPRNRQTGAGISFLLAGNMLALVLSGCFLHPATDGCAEIRVPPARAGDSYQFAARGRFYTNTLDTIVDWRVVDSNSTKPQGPIVFPDGGTLGIATGLLPSVRTSARGLHGSSYQVSYWADLADGSPPLPFRDEWIGVDSGELVQLSHRAILDQGDRVWHSTRLTFLENPGLLGAPLLWSIPLRKGTRIVHEFPEERHSPEIFQSARQQSLEFRVDRVDFESLPEPQCVAWVDMRLRLAVGPSFEDFSGQLKLASTVPLPLDYSLDLPDEWLGIHGEAFTLRLTSFLPGLGPSLAHNHGGLAAGPQEIGLAPVSPEKGFLASHEGVFSTSFDEVLEALRVDPNAGTWLSAHPRAVPTEVTHREGSPDSQILDRWEITWGDSASAEALRTIADRHRQIVNGSPPTFIVESQPRNYRGVPASDSRWVPLDQLARIVKETYLGDPETLRCDLVQGTCSIGTHEATGEPLAGGQPITRLSHPGLLVLVEAGWILQEDSLSEDALGLPIRWMPEGG